LVEYTGGISSVNRIFYFFPFSLSKPPTLCAFSR
jgi:hypothetical protein